MFEYMVETLGEPQHARRIDAIEAARYGGRVPEALIQFWVDHGRGAYLDGMHWICDPAPFDPLLALIFAGDPEFAPADMTAVAYMAFGTLQVWHRVRAGVLVGFNLSEVSAASERSLHDRAGVRFPDDFLIAAQVAVVSSQFEPWQRELFADAVARHGALAPEEVYGFVGRCRKAASTRSTTCAGWTRSLTSRRWRGSGRSSLWRRARARIRWSSPPSPSG
jgi:hypothetical protein